MKIIKKFYLAKKVGMTQFFTETGELVSVTLLEGFQNKIVQIKNEENDGYKALKIGYKLIKDNKLNKPEKGIYKNIHENYQKLTEFRLNEIENYKIGDSLSIDQFKVGEKVNINGVMKGRGFSGTVKRYNFTIGPITHGSKHHRRKGTSGAGTGQAKVWKGQKTAGHYGNVKITVKNIKIVKVDTQQNLIVVKGAVPGCNGGIVKIYN